MVGTLFKGEADMIGTSLTMTAERAEAVDYLLPIAQQTNTMLIRKSSASEAVSWRTFVAPFSPELWTLMMATTVVCGTSLTALGKRNFSYNHLEETSSH